MNIQKKTYTIAATFLLLLAQAVAFGQAASKDDLSKSDFGISMGYSYTGINFKEIDRLSTHLVNNTFNMRQKYRGDGFHVGIHKNVEEALMIELSFDSFKANDFSEQNGPAGGTNRLKGFQIPLMATYLVRDPERALNFSFGLGLQYLNARATQTANGYSNIPTSTISEFKISTGYASFSFGFQYRVLPNFFMGYQARLSVSPNGRSSDNGVIYLRYTVL